MPRVQQKRGTNANLTSVDPTPLAGELLVVTDENTLKIGNGSDAYTSLAYVTATPRSHKSTHATGGSDALTPSDIGAAPAASPTFSGTVTVSAGSGSAGSYLPAVVFSGDPNTGIQQIGGADSFSIVTAGTERVRVRSDGGVGLGSNGYANAALAIESQIDNSSVRTGVFVVPKASSSFTSGVIGVTTGAQMLVNATSSDVICFQARSAVMGTGASITNQFGLTVPSTFTQGTNNYALFLDIPVGANNYNIFSRNAKNFFGGSVGIGRTAPATPLDVDGDVTITDKIIHSGDTDTTIRFPANDAVAVETGGSERLRVKSTGAIRFVPLAADPASGEAGDVYYNSSTNKLRVYDGTNWVDLH